MTAPSQALPRSVIIDSGGGYHCYWLLVESFVLDDDEARSRADRLQKAWVELVGGDNGARDLARVLRRFVDEDAVIITRKSAGGRDGERARLHGGLSSPNVEEFEQIIDYYLEDFQYDEAIEAADLGKR